MTIYEHKQIVTVSGGSGSTLALRIPGGLINYVLVRALTNSTTTFKAYLNDADGTRRLDYGYHNGEIVDEKINIPATGTWTVGITNASVTDTFRVILAVRER